MKGGLVRVCIDICVKSFSSFGVGSRRFCAWPGGYQKNASWACRGNLFGNSHS